MTLDDLMLLLPALAAGVLVLLTHVPLGRQVLARGIIFLDLAIAQVAATGALVTLQLVHDHDAWQAQVGAGIAALGGALFLGWCDKRWPDIQEALIGLLFVLAAAAGIVLLAGNPHGGEHLRDLLAGQILWAGWGHIGAVAALSAAVLAGRAWFARRGGDEGFAFYALFAVAVTASVQLVGVLLVFASLIAPAVATRALAGNSRVAGAFGIGALGYGGGLAASLVFDLPAGAAIVCLLVPLAIVGLFVWRRSAAADFS